MFRRGLAGRHKGFQRSFDADAFPRDRPATDTDTTHETPTRAAAGRGQIDLSRHRTPAAFIPPTAGPRAHEALRRSASALTRKPPRAASDKVRIVADTH